MLFLIGSFWKVSKKETWNSNWTLLRRKTESNYAVMRVRLASNSCLRARKRITNVLMRLTFCFHAVKPVLLNLLSLFLCFSPLTILALPTNNRQLYRSFLSCRTNQKFFSWKIECQVTLRFVPLSTLLHPLPFSTKCF